MAKVRKKPLRGKLRMLLQMSPREFIEYEPKSIGEQMCCEAIQSAIKAGAVQLGAFNAVWDRAEGPVEKTQVDAAELHLKIIGMPDTVPVSNDKGDLPHGSADREAAEERARALDPALSDGGSEGDGRRHLPDAPLNRN